MSTVTPPKPLDALIERLRDASSRPGRNTLDVGHYWNLCDEAADALVHLAAQATGAAQDTKPLEAQVFKFLLGEEELDGMWFGKRKVGEPAYWWRHDLRAALAARDSVIAELKADRDAGAFHPWKTALEGTVEKMGQRITEIEEERNMLAATSNENLKNYLAQFDRAEQAEARVKELERELESRNA